MDGQNQDAPDYRIYRMTAAVNAAGNPILPILESGKS